MSNPSLTFVLHEETSKIINDATKIEIKYEIDSKNYVFFVLAVFF